MDSDSTQKNPNQKVSIAKHLEDELHLAAINMDKLATKGTKKRRRSADSNQLIGKIPIANDDSDLNSFILQIVCHGWNIVKRTQYCSRNI